MPSETFQKALLRGQGPAKRKAQGPGCNEEKGPAGIGTKVPEQFSGGGMGSSIGRWRYRAAGRQNLISTLLDVLSLHLVDEKGHRSSR
jgi:hypothetical protein